MHCHPVNLYTKLFFMLTGILTGCAGNNATLPAGVLQPPEKEVPSDWQPEKLTPNHLALARDLVHQGYYTVAMRQLTQALNEKTDDPEPHCLLGVCQRETGNLAAARNSFYRAIDLDPEYAPAYSGLGITYYLLNRDGPARDALEKAAKLNPADADYQNNLGVLELQRNRLDSARSYFEQCLRLDPGHSRAKNNLAECLVRLGQDDTALEFLKRHFPPATACNNLGGVYLATGQPALARRMFRQALDHDPNLAAARRNLNRMKKREDLTP